MSNPSLINLLHEHFVWVLIAGCFLTSIVLSAVTKIATTMVRERSRREIAAYVAEGSISAEQGERLIKADVNKEKAQA